MKIRGGEAHPNITRKRKAKSTDIEAQATKADPKRRRRTRRSTQRRSRNPSTRSIERTVTPNLRVDDPPLINELNLSKIDENWVVKQVSK